MKNIFFLLTLCGLSFAKSLIAEEKIISTNTSSEGKASSQQLVCYDLNNGGGSSYRFTDYAPNLGMCISMKVKLQCGKKYSEINFSILFP